MTGLLLAPVTLALLVYELLRHFGFFDDTPGPDEDEQMRPPGSLPFDHRSGGWRN